MESTSNTRLPTSIFVFLVVVGALRAHFYASQIPDVLASHFAQGGRANGWQSKPAFFVTELIVVIISTVIAFGVPRLLEALPISLVNIQNKDYWFAPERRENTIAFFGASFAWFGCAVLAFLLFVNELVFRANLAFPHQLDTKTFVTALFCFLAFVVIWVIRLILHFSRVPGKP